MNDHFQQVCSQEEWSDHKLEEVSHDMIDDEWYPDHDWTTKWNHQNQGTNVLSKKMSEEDAQLEMVSEPEIVMLRIALEK